MDELIDEMNYSRKRFGKIFIFSILATLGYFIVVTLLLPILKHAPLVPKQPLIFSFAGIALATYILSKTEFDSWPIYRVMTWVIAGLIFYFSLYIHQVTSAIFLFYIPIVLMLWMLMNLKTAIISSFFFVAICYFTHFIADYFLVEQIKHTAENEVLHKTQDYIIVAIATYFSFLTLYFQNLFNRIEIQILNFQDSGIEIEKSIFKRRQKFYEATEKYEFAPERAEALYDRIIQYFEDKKPFKDPDFSITILAQQLDTNSTYIYKTISLRSDKSFRELVNEYRIKHVLAAIVNNEHKVFTIEHIYLEAGFLQQSTFNRVFKKVTGLTPSQYIENLRK